MTQDEILTLTKGQARALRDLLMPYNEEASIRSYSSNQLRDAYLKLHRQYHGFRLQSGDLDDTLSSYNGSFRGTEKIHASREAIVEAKKAAKKNDTR